MNPTVSIPLQEFVQRSRKSSELCMMLNYYHDRILYIINTWTPNLDAIVRAEQIDKISELAGWIIQIRDKHGQYAERDIAYGCWIIWYILFPEWAMQILDQFVGGVGCWADIKYICGFLNRNDICDRVLDIHKKRITDVLLRKIVGQLYLDNKTWSCIIFDYFSNRLQFFSVETPSSSRKPLLPRPIAKEHLSLASKWMPRESSQYGYLFVPMVHIWAELHGHKIIHTRDYRKWCRLFRKANSKLNRELDTIEVKICAKQWDEIEPNKLTIGSMKEHFSVLIQKSKNFQQYVLGNPSSMLDVIFHYLMSHCSSKITTEIIPVLNELVDWFTLGYEFEALFQTRQILPWIAADEPIGSLAWWWAGFLAHYSVSRKIVFSCSDPSKLMEAHGVLTWLKQQDVRIILTDQSEIDTISQFVEHSEACFRLSSSSSSSSYVPTEPRPHRPKKFEVDYPLGLSILVEKT